MAHPQSHSRNRNEVYVNAALLCLHKSPRMCTVISSRCVYTQHTSAYTKSRYTKHTLDTWHSCRGSKPMYLIMYFMFTILGGDKAPPTAPFNGILCAQRATRKRTSKTERIESSSLRVIEDVASLVVRHRMNVCTHEKYTYTQCVHWRGRRRRQSELFGNKFQ